MTPAQFKSWRKSLGLKQREAADKLGLKKRMIQYYETGRRDGKKVEIPKSIRLACFALSTGVDEFEGSAPAPDGLASPNESAVAPGETVAQEAPPLAPEVTDIKKARGRKQKAA